MNPKQIRALRRINGWTQAELADRIGTDPVTISRWERGISIPRRSAISRLKDLANGLPRDVDFLVQSIGNTEVKRILTRELLLTRPPTPQRFVASPTRRLKEVEWALKEQTEMKLGMKFKR